MRKILLVGLVLLAACTERSGKYSEDSLIGYERPPRLYPQNGYVLGDDGKYVFKPLTMGR